MSKTDSLIQSAVTEALKAGIFPGLEVLVGKGGKILYHQTFGKVSKEPKAATLKAGNLFDLASLTKPLASTVVLLKLAEEGKVYLEEPVSVWLPELNRPKTKKITFKDLLTHRSGYLAWEGFFEPDFDLEVAKKRLLSMEPIHKVGEKMVYSCVNYLILGQAVQRIARMSLQEYFQEKILTKKETKSLSFFPDSNMAIPASYCKYRGKPLQGEVHDENAALFGLDAGNSGLFGSAEGVFAYLNRLLDPKESPLSSAGIEEMVSNHNPSTLPARGLGWDYNEKKGYMSCGDLMPMGSLGHLGFTGTSLWFEPKSGLTVILLSSRVNLSREETLPLMKNFRPKMHNLLLSTFV